MTNDLPEPWASELGPKGIHSYRDLGAKAEVSHETARRLCTGGKTSTGTVLKVANALFGGDLTKVYRLYGIAVDDHGPWELPPEARLLNEEQRKAVRAVVLAMIPPQAKRGGDGNADDGGGPAPIAPIRPLKDHEVDEAAYHPDDD